MGSADGVRVEGIACDFVGMLALRVPDCTTPVSKLLRCLAGGLKTCPIASCLSPAGAVATAELIDQIPGTVFAARDLVYERGTYEQFQTCYQLTWGRFKQRAGNHEYNGSDASGYFRYWGQQAGDPEKGYYSYDLGAWHIVVLNTNCSVKQLGGCGKGSPEERWLRQDLAAHPSACILAYGHHALFSSGISPRHALHPELRAFWEDLYAAHADLVHAGHEHSYGSRGPRQPAARHSRNCRWHGRKESHISGIASRKQRSSE